MTNKVVLLTGSTSGIGRDLAFYFAKENVHLVLLGRNKSKLNTLKSEIILKTTCEIVDTHICDFANLEQVKEAASTLSNFYEKIDMVIHNAGALADKKGVTIDGIPYTMVVNYLGPKILNEHLLQLLEKSDDPHILHTSSSTLPKKLTLYDLEHINQYGRIKAYGMSKLCFYLYLTDLNQTKAKIKVFDPGIVYTNATKGMMPKYLKVFAPLIHLVSRMPKKVTQEVDKMLLKESDEHLSFYVKGKKTKLKPLYNNEFVKSSINQYIAKIYQ